jgi:hypothetical protein
MQTNGAKMASQKVLKMNFNLGKAAQHGIPFQSRFVL